ncbi:hypothetical protein GWI33_006430 [Rhynchophorus ferrugineus]|uniref:Uncharacterized protein n=1 Tax=Rhynchophorus ferrugineus TaxID=354439 RepID=A0A834MIZ0_RHYFE|nr:hypothetical protein GWI33_006430 [Rhynchophorus ferrugineus]
MTNSEKPPVTKLRNYKVYRKNDFIEITDVSSTFCPFRFFQPGKSSYIALGAPSSTKMIETRGNETELSRELRKQLSRVLRLEWSMVAARSQLPRPVGGKKE